MCHDARNGGGIDTARQVQAHRDIGSKTHPHGVYQFLADFLDHDSDRGLVVRPSMASMAFGRVPGVLRIPVRSRAQLGQCCRGPNLHPVSWCELSYAGKHGPLVGEPSRRRNAVHIPRRGPAETEKRLRFGRKQDPVLLHGPEERFDAVPVSCRYDLSGRRSLVYNHERKLAAEMLEEPRRAVDAVERQHQLAVATAAKTVPEGLAVSSELLILVDFADDHAMDLAVCPMQRLGA